MPLPVADARLSISGNDLLLKVYTDVNLGAVRRLLRYDEKLGCYRAYPMHYGEISNCLLPKYALIDEIAPLVNEELTFSLESSFELRDYQQEAVTAWVKNDCRGVVVLPTGTGKTFVAMHAIALLKLKTLVVVPTINLLQQWKEALEKYLGARVGILGGGEEAKKEITVTTYDSAYRHAYGLLGYGLLVFDEVHHLPSPMYRKIAQALPAPRRLGITATPERTDDLHVQLEQLVGREVYRATHEEVQEHIASFEIRKIFVRMNDRQMELYERKREIFRAYCLKKKIYMFSPQAFRRLIVLSFRDREAREALKAHAEARQLALNSEAKLAYLEGLLGEHRQDKVVIFSEFNSVVRSLSRTLFIPAITYKTKTREREELLSAFRKGTFTKLATSKVLDEGWDVQDASVGIVVSGSSVKRQLIQRLGRLLRKKDGKRAILYELISKGTTEADASRRRALPVAGPGPGPSSGEVEVK